MTDVYEETLNVLESSIADLDKFLEPQQEQAAYYKKLAKQLYKLSSKLQNGQISNSKALPKLLIDGFDEEQIWQQLELRNIPILKHYQKQINQFDPDSLVIDCDKNESVSEVPALDKSSSDEHENEGYVFDDDSDSDILDSVRPEQLKKRNENEVKKRQKSIIDDQFFKQSELEEFLKIEDIKFENEAAGKVSVDDNSEEIDWEKDFSDKSDTEVEEKSSRDVMYADFFDPPENSDKDDERNMSDDDANDESQYTTDRSKYDTRDYEFDEEDDVDEDEINDQTSIVKHKNLSDAASTGNEKGNEERQEKTAFEKQQEVQQSRIKEMEEKLLKPKPWQLTGEVEASQRPENSLMRQPTTFDATPKQSVYLTADLTTKIEEVICMAISNKAWNDVERKVKPKENVALYKKFEPLDQTKSKKSLAEVYEEDYLKLKNKPEDVEDPRHTEILKLMDELTPELYALFSHIPKPPVPEIKVVNNMPAITVEEVAPVGLSDAALLAPEEVKKKPKGDMKSETEKSATDKKRERRKKKLLQKLKQKKKEEKLHELAATNPALAEKYEKALALKQLKQSKNAIIVNNDKTKKLKSSKDFFTRLDETVSKKSVKLK